MANATIQVTAITGSSITVTMTDGSGTTVSGHVIDLRTSGLDFTLADATVIAAAKAFLVHYLRNYWLGVAKVKAPAGPDAAVIAAFSGPVTDDGSIP